MKLFYQSILLDVYGPRLMELFLLDVYRCCHWTYELTKKELWIDVKQQLFERRTPMAEVIM